MMTREDRFKVPGFICLALAIVFMILFSAVKSFGNMTEDNTVLYVATVRSIERKTIGDNGTEIMIHTEEFPNAFRVMGRLCSALGTDKMFNIEKGDKISFRIEATESSLLSEETAFVNIVSLRTNDAELISLNEYNSIMHETLMPTKTANIVLIVILFGLAIYFFARAKKYAAN